MRPPASLLFALAALASVAPGMATAGDRVIYQDSLQPGWEDWSYSATVNLSNFVPSHTGLDSIAVTLDAYGGLSLRTSPPLSTSPYGAIRFWILGGAGDTQLVVYTQTMDSGGEGPTVPVTGPAGAWTRITVPLSDLGSPAQIARITLQDATGSGGHPTFYVDDISLLAKPNSYAGFPDPSADRVIGQPGFGTNGFGTTAQSLYGPAGIAVGPDGRFFVADYWNSRVLSYSSAAELQLNDGADLVFGQPDLMSGDSGASTHQMNLPEGLTVDPQGNLFVADTSNHRVLVFKPPFIFNGVDGIAFGSMNCATPPTLDELCDPRGLASDAEGNIYLADEFHDRILIYRTPVASNDFTPDLVLTGLGSPRGVAVDANGNVFATDSEGDRVLEYDSPLTTDTIPDRTFGSGPDGSDCFTNTNGVGASPTTFACPVDLAVDARGSLFVSDLYNNRVLAFENPLTSDAVPDAVYGQHGSFSSGQANAGGIDGQALHTPLGLAIDTLGDLYIADFDNNRVLSYSPAVPEPGALGCAVASLATLLLLARRH